MTYDVSTIQTDDLDVTRTVPLDATGTIGLYALPRGSIGRSFQLSALFNPDAAVDIAYDVGLVYAGVETVSDPQADIHWFTDVDAKSVSAGADIRDQYDVSAQFFRVRVTTAASAGDEARLGVAVGRS